MINSARVGGVLRATILKNLIIYYVEFFRLGAKRTLVKNQNQPGRGGGMSDANL